MTRAWRTIIAAVLAFWMPLCCCQIAAIAGTGAPCCAEPDAPASSRAAPDSCCAATRVPSCCAPAAEDGASPQVECGGADADCGDGLGGEPASDPCMCCATKAPAPEQDPVDPILSTHAAWAAVPAALLASSDVAMALPLCNGSPGAPDGRATGMCPWPCGRAAERCAQLSCWTE